MADSPSQQSLPEPSLNNLGRIEPRPIIHEMEESYLNYAMSVIVGVMSGAAFSFLLMGPIAGYILGKVLH
jgi:hypothetical protein